MINLGLRRTQRLLQYIAQDILRQPNFNPAWKAFHIAGTNGKGSVAAYLSAYLELATSAKVGRFTSPHFIDRWDCISINSEPISRALFEGTERRIRQLADRVSSDLETESRKDTEEADNLSKIRVREASEPTEFEILTATAFAIFTEQSCAFTVIECGLGGRLDATNALPDSAVATSIITRIGLDHVEILGGSLRSIVKEKCGIFRNGVPVVVDGDNDLDVLQMIEEEVQLKFNHISSSTSATLGPVSVSNYFASSKDLDEILGECRTHMSSNTKSPPEAASSKERDTVVEGSSLLLNLRPHQKSNLAVALKAVQIAIATPVQRPIIADGHKSYNSAPSAEELENVVTVATRSYPGRLQFLRPGWLNACPNHDLHTLNKYPILLDGAHNTQSAQVLYDYVRELTRHTQLNSSTDLPMGLSDKKTNRPVMWVMALSHGGSPNKVFETLFPDKEVKKKSAIEHMEGDHLSEYQKISAGPFRIILTSFGSVQGMPWIKSRDKDDLQRTMADCGLQDYVENDESSGDVSNIATALEHVDRSLHNTFKGRPEHEQPIIVVTGSLYLVSDFLRFVRDGKSQFLRCLNNTESSIKIG